MAKSKVSEVIAAGAATKLWRTYQFTSVRELVLEDLALALGVLVIEDRLDTAEARLVRNKARGLIRVRREIPERGRKRFAIAHELGHWLLHRQQNQINLCTEADMLGSYKTSDPEIEANCFAAELLMPHHLFQPHLVRTRPSFRLFSEMAAEFDASLTSTALRCVELTDDYWAVVVSEQGRIKWWRGSMRFSDRFYITAGSQLAQQTIAASFFRGEAPPQIAVEVDSDDWAETRRGYDPAIFLEEIFPLIRYNQVLSLIYLS